MQLSAKARLICIIVAVVFMFGALAGTGAYLIINHINKSNALLSETTYDLGNLVDTSDKSKLDTTTVTKILDILGDYNGSTIRTAANLKSLNANKPIVFQMGEINGNKIYWEAVYQTGAVLTIWMTNPYTAEWFNDKDYAMKNPDLAGYDKGKYDDLGNYSQSGLRDVTKGIYTEQSQLFPAISSIVVSPSEALPDPNNEADKGIDWQKDCTSTAGVGQPDTGYAHHNGLQSANGTGSYTTWTWDSTAYNDKFWIPSYYEVFGKNTGKNNWTFDGGLWALTADDIKFSQTSNGLNGVSGVGSYCWLRSGSL